jgi:hypothetical protein
MGLKNFIVQVTIFLRVVVIGHFAFDANARGGSETGNGAIVVVCFSDNRVAEEVRKVMEANTPKEKSKDTNNTQVNYLDPLDSRVLKGLVGLENKSPVDFISSVVLTDLYHNTLPDPRGRSLVLESDLSFDEIRTSRKEILKTKSSFIDALNAIEEKMPLSQFKGTKSAIPWSNDTNQLPRIDMECVHIPLAQQYLFQGKKIVEYDSRLFKFMNNVNKAAFFDHEYLILLRAESKASDHKKDPIDKIRNVVELIYSKNFESVSSKLLSTTLKDAYLLYPERRILELQNQKLLVEIAGEGDWYKTVESGDFRYELATGATIKVSGQFKLNHRNEVVSAELFEPAVIDDFLVSYFWFNENNQLEIVRISETIQIKLDTGYTLELPTQSLVKLVPNKSLEKERRIRSVHYLPVEEFEYGGVTCAGSLVSDLDKLFNQNSSNTIRPLVEFSENFEAVSCYPRFSFFYEGFLMKSAVVSINDLHEKDFTTLNQDAVVKFENGKLTQAMVSHESPISEVVLGGNNLLIAVNSPVQFYPGTKNIRTLFYFSNSFVQGYQLDNEKVFYVKYGQKTEPLWIMHTKAGTSFYENGNIKTAVAGSQPEGGADGFDFQGKRILKGQTLVFDESQKLISATFDKPNQRQ